MFFTVLLGIHEHQRSGGQFSPPSLLKLPRPLPLKQGRPQKQQHPHHHHQLQQQQQRRPVRLDRPSRRNDEGTDEEEESGGFANFLGIKLPELELPELPKLSLPSFLGGSGDEDEAEEGEGSEGERGQRRPNVVSEAIPVSLGREPPRDALDTAQVYN